MRGFPPADPPVRDTLCTGTTGCRRARSALPPADPGVPAPHQALPARADFVREGLALLQAVGVVGLPVLGLVVVAAPVRPGRIRFW